MSNNRPLIIVACVVLAIIGGTLWFLNTQKVPETPPKSSAETKLPVSPTVTPDTTTPPSTTRVPSTNDLPKATANTPKATPRPLQEWELKIDEVLRSTADESQTAQILINMLPAMPPDGQSEAAQHIANLLLDEQYSKVLPLLKNAALPEEVLDVFVTDLMNREDKVKLPALLDIAKIPNHPHHEEALTDLEIFLDEDFGSDWNKWQTAVGAYIKKQEDEEKEAGGQ